MNKEIQEILFVCAILDKYNTPEYSIPINFVKKHLIEILNKLKSFS